MGPGGRGSRTSASLETGTRRCSGGRQGRPGTAIADLGQAARLHDTLDGFCNLATCNLHQNVCFCVPSGHLVVAFRSVYSCSMPNHGSSPLNFSMSSAALMRRFVGSGCTGHTHCQRGARRKEPWLHRVHQKSAVHDAAMQGTCLCTQPGPHPLSHTHAGSVK